jgi:hypothetical protein
MRVGTASSLSTAARLALGYSRGGGLALVDPAWQIAASGDYNGDGKADMHRDRGLTP